MRKNLPPINSHIIYRFLQISKECGWSLLHASRSADIPQRCAVSNFIKSINKKEKSAEICCRWSHVLRGLASIYELITLDISQSYRKLKERKRLHAPLCLRLHNVHAHTEIIKYHMPILDKCTSLIYPL